MDLMCKAEENPCVRSHADPPASPAAAPWSPPEPACAASPTSAPPAGGFDAEVTGLSNAPERGQTLLDRSASGCSNVCRTDYTRSMQLLNEQHRRSTNNDATSSSLGQWDGVKHEDPLAVALGEVLPAAIEAGPLGTMAAAGMQARGASLKQQKQAAEMVGNVQKLAGYGLQMAGRPVASKNPKAVMGRMKAEEIMPLDSGGVDSEKADSRPPSIVPSTTRDWKDPHYDLKPSPDGTAAVIRRPSPTAHDARREPDNVEILNRGAEPFHGLY